MARKTKMAVAALVTVLSLGGLTAFAMGVAQTGSGTSASSLSGDSAKAEVIRRKKVKIVRVKPKVAAASYGSSGTYSSSGYTTYSSNGGSSGGGSNGSGSSATRPTTVTPPSSSNEGGWEDDDHGSEHEEGDDD